MGAAPARVRTARRARHGTSTPEGQLPPPARRKDQGRRLRDRPATIDLRCTRTTRTTI